MLTVAAAPTAKRFSQPAGTQQQHNCCQHNLAAHSTTNKRHLQKCDSGSQGVLAILQQGPQLGCSLAATKLPAHETDRQQQVAAGQHAAGRYYANRTLKLISHNSDSGMVQATRAWQPNNSLV